MTCGVMLDTLKPHVNVSVAGQCCWGCFELAVPDPYPPLWGQTQTPIIFWYAFE